MKVKVKKHKKPEQPTWTCKLQSSVYNCRHQFEPQIPKDNDTLKVAENWFHRLTDAERERIQNERNSEIVFDFIMNLSENVLIFLQIVIIAAVFIIYFIQKM